MTKKYKSSGLVYGNLWGGGEGAYQAEKLENKSLKALLSKNKKMLKEGTLDYGMGYESLIGAYLIIETIETIKKNEKEYSSSDYDNIFIGDLSEKQKDFLVSCDIL